MLFAWATLLVYRAWRISNVLKMLQQYAGSADPIYYWHFNKWYGCKMQLPGVDHRRDHRYQPQTHHMLATAFRLVGSLCHYSRCWSRWQQRSWPTMAGGTRHESVLLLYDGSSVSCRNLHEQITKSATLNCLNHLYKWWWC